MKFSSLIPSPPLVLVRLALIGASFSIAYRAQRYLETQDDLRLGWILFAVAALPLYGAWFLGRRAVAPAADETPDLESQSHAGEESSSLSIRLYSGAARTRRFLVAYWPLLLILGLAAALRFYRLGSLPFGVSFDEAQNGLEARRILEDPWGYHPIFIAEASQLPALFFYVFAAAMKILGQGIFALRTTTALAGILTVPALYLLGRELFGNRVGLLAALLLAVMRWHLNFSRIAFHGVFGPLFMVLSLYFLARGLKGHGWQNFAVSGVLLGIGLQTYYAFALVPLVIVLYWLHHTIFEGRRRLLPLAGGLALVVLTSGLIVLPLARYAFDNTELFTQRAKTVSITTDRSADEVAATVARSTKTHALMFNVQGDRNGRHNLPPLPMLDRYTAIFFVLGITLALIRPHDSRYFLLLAWLAVLMQSGIWSLEGEAPQAYRTLMVTPAVALLAALPLGLLANIALDKRESSAALLRGAGNVAARGLAYARGNAFRGAAALGLLFLLAQVAYLNYNTFFNEQLPSAFVWQYFRPVETTVGQELDRLGPDVAAYSSATVTNSPTQLFLTPDAPPLTTIVLPRDVPFQDKTDVVVFLDGRDQRDREAFLWLQRLYPLAEFSEHHPPGEPQTTVLYEIVIDRALIDASYGVEATYISSEDGDTIARRETAIAADWRQGTPVAAPFNARWSATIKIPEDANRGLRLEAPGSVRLSLDGVTVAEGERSIQTTSDLAIGLHDLVVDVAAVARGEVRLLWLTAEEEWLPVPPSSLFQLPIGARGLRGTYYGIEDTASPLTPAGPLVEQRVDPYVSYRYHVSPLTQPGPFLVIWTGSLTVPEPEVINWPQTRWTKPHSWSMGTST